MKFYEYACQDFEERMDIMIEDARLVSVGKHEGFVEMVAQIEPRDEMKKNDLANSLIGTFIAMVEFERDFFLSRMYGTKFSEKTKFEELDAEIVRLIQKSEQCMDMMTSYEL